ncbi:MAG: 1,4-dihydroxy-2-naphthoate polyprenyltransferase [Anaerolineaceae bacterium]|nr:1,4-dihydroxy-2-naphthoate polyprenyltransferase [Anaerolineaceae bacterium]
MTTISTRQAWLLASRPKTLPAAAAPVIAGCAVAFSEGGFRPGPALAALAGALLLQIGANIANDYFDYQKGADTQERLGPLRVTQAGLLAPQQMVTGMLVVFGLATLVGVYLAFTAGWPVVAIGALSILAALAYTGGPYPLGYHGLGEVFVFVFFGLAAVVGTYFVQTLRVSPAAFLAAVPLGLLTVAILVVNNLRDIATDRDSGKHTLAVRFGERWARGEYALCVYGAYLAVLAAALGGQIEPWSLLVAASLPLAVQRVRRVHRWEGRQLNLLLAQTGQLELVFALLYGLGALIGYLV